MLGTDQLQAGRFSRDNFDADELKALAQSLESLAFCNRWLCARSKARPIVLKSLPANAAGAPRKSPSFTPCRPWCRSCPTARRWRWHYRKCAARRSQPMEESEAYQRLIDEFSYTQAELAEVVGKSRSHIANLLRLAQATPGMRDCWCRARSAWAMPAHCSAIRRRRSGAPRGCRRPQRAAVEALVGDKSVTGRQKAGRQERQIRRQGCRHTRR